MRLQDAWVGHVVKVSSKANKIMMGVKEDETGRDADKNRGRTLEVGSHVILNCTGVKDNAFRRPISRLEKEPYWCTVLSVNGDGTVDLSCPGQSLLASGIIKRVPEHLVRTHYSFWIKSFEDPWASDVEDTPNPH